MFGNSIEVDFLKIDEPKITELMRLLKDFKQTIRFNYESDLFLQQNADKFVKVLQRVVGVLRDYSTYVKANQQEIFEFAKILKTPNYIGLYEEQIAPILRILKELLSENRNGYVTKIEEMIDEIGKDGIYLITKYKMHVAEFEFKNGVLPIMRDKDFIEAGIYAQHLIFIGTPSYFSLKFSNIFYANKTTFLGYSCFENKINVKNAFFNFLTEEFVINTIYKDSLLAKGFSGIDYSSEIEKPLEKNLTEEVILAVTKRNQEVERKQRVEAVAAYISNKHFLFIPVNQRVNILNRDSLEVEQSLVKDIKEGDLLIFRSQNGADLIREVADEIIGEEAPKLRKHLAIWKSKLIANVDKYGLEKVSIILRQKYKITSATEANIKNWMNPYSIKPRSLEQLLTVLKFDERTQKIIQSSATKIRNAHTAAGHSISRRLKQEINQNIESIIDEKGYYRFESTLFKGASFNIEEIQKLTEKTFSIPENDVLKIFSI